MGMVEKFLAWFAPVLSTIIITIVSASINAQVKHHEMVAEERHSETEAKRKAEKEWQDSVIKRLDKQVERLDEQDRRIDTVLSLQCSQTRSDILHKCHRYLDDVGKASTEEKDALKAEHDDYAKICEANDIENKFIDLLVQRVMDLPERDV